MTGVNVASMVITAAQRTPQAFAVEETDRRITYAGLLSAARALATELSRNARPGQVVAIHLPRGGDFITAALASMLARMPFIPIDPHLPAARIEQLKTLAGAGCVVEWADKPVVRVLGAGGGPASPDAEVPVYTIFTSGSSGEPKAVEVGQSSLANLVRWHNAAYGVGPGTRALHTAGVSFDATMWELWPYLAAGGTVVVAPDEVRTMPDLLAEFAAQRDIDVAFVTTPLAEELLRLPEVEPGWRLLLTGGDRLQMSQRPVGYRLVNHYGPTEATVVTTAGDVTDCEDLARPPIGRPIAGAEVLLLDEDLRLVPAGEVGEIVIGGRGVALGYRGRPDLTEAAFLGLPGRRGRWYRSGDLARELADGSLDFLGRRNADQLKVRGVRVEAAEIEGAMLRHPHARAALAVTTGLASSESQLTLLLVTDGTQIGAREAREFLGRHLAPWCIPDRFRRVPRLPLTANGKVDRAAARDLAHTSGEEQR
jgi:amino acid adenylation domain-containing protein